MHWAAILTIVSAVVVTTFGTRPTLRRLPEPVDGGDKPLYRDLGTTRFVALSGACTALGMSLAASSLGSAEQPLWWVLTVFGVLLAGIDARTTWLPLTLTRTSWLAMAIAALLAAGVAGDGWLALRAMIGAVLAGGLYRLVWSLSRGGFGFGDVRFAPLIGAAAAGHSWRLLIWALFLGSLTGGMLGAYRLACRRSGPFPYAPAMLIGAYAGCLIEGLS